MAESRWYVSVDGQQLESDYDLDAARELVQKNLGKRVLVWTQGMSQWSLPEELTDFRMPLPRPAPIPEPEPPPPVAEEKDAFKSLKTAVEREEIRKQAGFLKALLDFRFQEMITGKILPVLYAITIILVVLGAIYYFLFAGGGMILAGIKLKAPMSILIGLLIMVLTPVLAVVYLALIRMWFELVLVIFRIKDDLSVLVNRNKEAEKEEEI